MKSQFVNLNSQTIVQLLQDEKEMFRICERSNSCIFTYGREIHALMHVFNLQMIFPRISRPHSHTKPTIPTPCYFLLKKQRHKHDKFQVIIFNNDVVVFYQCAL